MKISEIALLAIFAFSAISSTRAGTLVLDPGHGGSDRGVEVQGMTEKDLTLEIAKRIGRVLVARGDPAPVLTRKGDYPLSEQERRRIANTNAPGLLVSLHFAVAPDRTKRGAQVYVLLGAATASPGFLVPLEEAHNRSASDSLRLGNALVEALSTKDAPAKLHVSPQLLSPLTGITLPAALVELDYLTAPDASRWRDPLTLDNVANQLIEAVDRFAPGGNNPAP